MKHERNSSIRLAIVAATVLATAGVLTLVTIEARRAEQALETATAHTLRDYTGYAGRMLGGEVLRRFSEQRAYVFAPVVGSSGRAVAEPTLDEVVRRGEAQVAAFPFHPDSGRGYFRLDLRTGAIEGRGAVQGEFARAIADTLTKLARDAHHTAGMPDIIVVPRAGVAHSVSFAHLLDPRGRPAAMYGYTYTRSAGVADVAQRVFRETPLLPTSFAGARWNYDTTQVRPGEVVNDSLLAIRITDRAGRVLWQSDARAFAHSAAGERVVLSTSAGGFDIETSIKPAGEPTLVPSIVRRAQSWTLRALLALAMALAVVSLLALRRERIGAQARRTEAMQQLALGLRHELNNALASVMLNAELLHEEKSFDEDQRERVRAIVEQAERMRGVLRRLEKTEDFDVVVPYLDEGYMVDLSTPAERDRFRTEV